MQLPPLLLESLTGLEGFDRSAFVAEHESGSAVTSIRVNPRKPADLQAGFSRQLHPGQDPLTFSPVPWSRHGHYLSRRPSFTFDPLFHAGCYYVQEASSMLLEQALLASVDLDAELRVLDLCAAPGGKSTHLQSLLRADSLLVSNEVIRSRVPVLRDNCIKWGGANVLVTNNDPADLGVLVNYFDVLVVDAPCSGSGLFRRDAGAISEWNEKLVPLCAGRQRRILADIWPSLKPGGILIYSTCSYSREEDEGVLEWLLQEFSAEPVPWELPPEWHVSEAGMGYRCWPHRVKGEGFFISCIRKTSEEGATWVPQRRKIIRAEKRQEAMLSSWINLQGYALVTRRDKLEVWPEKRLEDFSFLYEKLRVMYAGVQAGTFIRDKFLPEHNLAMSHLLLRQVPRLSLNYEQAIAYLQRKDFHLDVPGKGWMLTEFAEQTLGWINRLPNRFNNYYPKELRILRPHP